ncbi:hypothetical protein L6164_028428 [Bauhinia variegata]|uniref:Uncharacterized protein n=1 Tax=Bauhinia variegata TaxID=167791 RepID=A0ACB9L7F4_BAUVA|nr:hypothetical protein L6164_028428 [Bauhinia variegata]
MLNAFYIVLLMDNTYKTNKHQLPLLEIVVVASNEMTFSMAFAFMVSKCANNFVRALEKLRGLFWMDDALPRYCN